MILLSGRSEHKDVDAERSCFHKESPFKGIGGVALNGHRLQSHPEPLLAAALIYPSSMAVFLGKCLPFYLTARTGGPWEFPNWIFS